LQLKRFRFKNFDSLFSSKFLQQNVLHIFFQISFLITREKWLVKSPSSMFHAKYKCKRLFVCIRWKAKRSWGITIRGYSEYLSNESNFSNYVSRLRPIIKIGTRDYSAINSLAKSISNALAVTDKVLSDNFFLKILLSMTLDIGRYKLTHSINVLPCCYRSFWWN